MKNVIIIGDFGKDLDDEHTLLIASALHKQGKIDLKLVIGNLAPAKERAMLAKGILELVELGDIPVMIGEEVIANNTQHYEMDIPYLSNNIIGEDIFIEVLEKCDDNSISLILQSGLTDACKYLEKYPSLFKAKVAEVSIMGGVELVDEDNPLLIDNKVVPNNANNNTFDMDSAKRVYDELQNMGIVLKILTRDMAYKAQFPIDTYNIWASTEHIIPVTMKNRQKKAFEHLWLASCSEEGSEIRGSLPMDRNKEWFETVFCGKKEINSIEEVWDNITGFALYDPLNLLTIFDNEKYFSPFVVNDNVLIFGLSNKHNDVNIENVHKDIVNLELSLF